MHRETIIKEFIFKTSRSSGAGGQHVNKTETRVELFFNIHQSKGLSLEEKKQLFIKLKPKLIKGSLIRVVSQESRSQLTNKDVAIKKLLTLITENIKTPKKRKPTRIPKSKIEKRLSDKKNKAETKANRKRINF